MATLEEMSTDCCCTSESAVERVVLVETSIDCCCNSILEEYLGEEAETPNPG